MKIDLLNLIMMNIGSFGFGILIGIVLEINKSVESLDCELKAFKYDKLLVENKELKKTIENLHNIYFEKDEEGEDE